ncbi:hypothetical protein P692DRAFT_20851329 [Suillus brevipes Sb2]|nr:hypothetical protein P692DRAFT_20851329 [Suillus brevipes Sb2]
MVHSVYAPSPTTSNKLLPSKNPRSGSPETMSGVMDKSAQVPARFSMSGLAALHLSLFAQGFSNGKRQAATCALLKHKAHIDGTHYHTRKPDLFDAITMQDCLDGGISILMCCVGSEASETLSPEHFTVDLYITLREHCETPERIGGDLLALVQAFSEEFVIPHLQCYAEHCHIEGIIPPWHSAIQMGQVMAKGSPLSKSKSEMRQRHNADTFLLNATQQGTATIPKPPSTKNMTKSTGAVASFQAETPLISIGLHSDAMLDHFGLDDHILPKLHQLIGSVRSGCWKAMFQSLK